MNILLTKFTHIYKDTRKKLKILQETNSKKTLRLGFLNYK